MASNAGVACGPYRAADELPSSNRDAASHAFYRRDASVHVEGSRSSPTVPTVEQQWCNAHPEAPIARRVDRVVDPWMAAGTEPIHEGKPAGLATVGGGNHQSGTTREGWDHATGWKRRIPADVWKLDLKAVETEFTLVGVNPALDLFKDLARELPEDGQGQAQRSGRQLGAVGASLTNGRTGGRIQAPGPDRDAG